MTVSSIEFGSTADVTGPANCCYYAATTAARKHGCLWPAVINSMLVLLGTSQYLSLVVDWQETVMWSHRHRSLTRSCHWR